MGILTGPRGWCSQTAWPSAGRSRARHHVAAAAGAPGTEGSQGTRSLLQPSWGSRVVLPLVLGSGSEHGGCFWRRSSTPRPRMTGQIRPLGTNGKEGIALAIPLATSLPPGRGWVWKLHSWLWPSGLLPSQWTAVDSTFLGTFSPTVTWVPLAAILGKARERKEGDHSPISALIDDFNGLMATHRDSGLGLPSTTLPSPASESGQPMRIPVSQGHWVVERFNE